MELAEQQNEQWLAQAETRYDQWRAQPGLEPELRQGKDVLIVGHGAMNASIICQIRQIPLKDFWGVKMKNAELLRLC